MKYGFKSFLIKSAAAVAAALFCAVSGAAAQPILRLPSVLGDHMVLQRNATVKLWGWADPRSEVSIVAGWQDMDTVRVTAGGDTKWQAELRTPAAPGPYTIAISTKKKKVVLEDVLCGETWLCSGQSNMNWSSMNGIQDMKDELKKELNPQIRLFTVTKQSALWPQEDCDGRWEICTPQSAQWFSAVGYFFGKKLAAEMGCPVGLVNSSWGGSPAETWTPAGAFGKRPDLAAQWKKVPKSTGWDINIGTTYNAMIHPLLNMVFSGVIWYQGEANVPNGETYGDLFSLMINSWRAEFGQELPFYFVQIAPYGRYNVPGGAALVREGQASVASTLPKTGLVAVPDLVDDVMNIHPKYKHEVGNRLANWALTEVYGRKGLPHEHPRYREMKKEGSRIRIFFDHAGGQIYSREGKPAMLEICDRTMKFVPAEGKLDPQSNTLLVWSKEIKDPVAVRYSFSNDAIGNLFGESGLPVLPFRTDTDNNAVSAVFPRDPVTTCTVRVHGEGYEPRLFEKGALPFRNRNYPLVAVPEEFAGFTMLAGTANGNDTMRKTAVTPDKDGRVYILARKNSVTDTDLDGWKMVRDSETRYETNGKPGILYIYYRDARAGTAVELPVTTDFAGVTPLARKIRYTK